MLKINNKSKDSYKCVETPVSNVSFNFVCFDCPQPTLYLFYGTRGNLDPGFALLFNCIVYACILSHSVLPQGPYQSQVNFSELGPPETPFKID